MGRFQRGVSGPPRLRGTHCVRGPLQRPSRARAGPRARPQRWRAARLAHAWALGKIEERLSAPMATKLAVVTGSEAHNFPSTGMLTSFGPEAWACCLTKPACGQGCFVGHSVGGIGLWLVGSCLCQSPTCRHCPVVVGLVFQLSGLIRASAAAQARVYSPPLELLWVVGFVCVPRALFIFRPPTGSRPKTRSVQRPSVFARPCCDTLLI